MKPERASIADSFIPVGYELRFIDDDEKASVKDFFMPGNEIAQNITLTYRLNERMVSSL